MADIPLEKRLERYDTIPQTLRDALNSEAVDKVLWTIGEVHHLGEERTFKIVRVVGLVIMGFIHPNDLAKEAASETGIDKRLAEEIACEIQLKILNPLMPEINAAFNYHITGIPPVTTTPSPPPQPEILRPAFAPPVRSDQPFILHEEQISPPAGGARARPRSEESLVRPSFYEETRDKKQETRSIERPTAARLEIGGTEEVQQEEPRVGKTETPAIRVVHYSGPQTPVDPFAPQEPSKDVHPENIIDLKDLPK